ncbi:putative IQ domain-containing protein IQM2-like [Sesbania bispinosa]|nr:putative IQ domain-containing protein IQM2-like [Sesbania bispinosa]
MEDGFDSMSASKEKIWIRNIASTNTLAFDKENKDQCLQSAIVDPKHMAAAVKLQKVYKSFRTRRKLADCAILIEQNWWKLLDFAELKHSSISFFDIEKHETAISRWSRARTRAAKVGKGLSKDAKAQKLALQHWLEAIDPRHRYGHNLHFYYDKWLKSESREPFFYWLDIGEGKEINLGKCPRSKLQQQCVKYLGPMERLPYEVVVEDGKLLYKQSREFLHTTREGSRAKWIFVLSTSKTLYVGKKKKGSFQHSSFLAGGATSCAGRLVVEHGVLKAVWPHSGHYRPTEENFKEFISFLQENNVDLSNVKMTSVDDLPSPRKRGHPRSLSSQEDLTEDMSGLEDEVEDPIAEKANLMETLVAPKTRQFQIFGRELISLQIPKMGQMLGGLDNGKGCASSESFQMYSSTTSGPETPHDFASELDHNFSDSNHAEINPKVSISKRVTSQKEMKSYQLGKQLSCKWTTGAGPRIGCVRGLPL